MPASSESESSRRLVVGAVFQRNFRIDAILGEGGMGRVFAAHDVSLDRPVAIKLLLAQPDRDEAAARFLREAKVLARLSSEHTVRIYAVGRDDRGAPFIVMERALGRSLEALVEERGPLRTDEAVDYIRQICAVLAEAHGHAIVHRDIKPANILVDEASVCGPQVKVVDFGVAKARSPGQEASGLTQASSLLGTPRYMAPEQLYSARDVDQRADIWGLGATLYFMLVGEAPFDGADLGQLMDRIQHGPAPSVRGRRPDVPPYIEEVVVRCLHRDPHGRFASAQDVVRALRVATSWSDGLPSLDDDDETVAAFDATALIRAAPSSSDPIADQTLPWPFPPSSEALPPSALEPPPPPVVLEPLPPPPPQPVSTVPPAMAPLARSRWGWLWTALALFVGGVFGAIVMRLLTR